MLIIGIAGGTGAGKSTFVKDIKNNLKNKVACISHDSYYRDLSNLSLKERKKINFDHPSSLETNLLIKHLKLLKQDKNIKVPVYDFIISNRTKQTINLKPKSVIIIEGILIFENKKLRELMDIKVFINADADVRLGRRIKRDIQKRNRTLNFSLDQYLTMSKPMHAKFVEPNKQYADIIIPKGGKNKKALKMVLSLIKNELN